MQPRGVVIAQCSLTESIGDALPVTKNKRSYGALVNCTQKQESCKIHFALILIKGKQVWLGSKLSWDINKLS